MRKRNKSALLLVFPIAVFVWFIGWILYWTGSMGKASKLSKATDSELTFAVLIPEKTYAK